MASLHRRKHSPYWWVKFRDDRGVIRFRSTKETDRLEALKILLRYSDGAKAARKGELTRAAVLKTFNEMLQRATGETVTALSVKNYFAQWTESKVTAAAASGTLNRYRPVLQGFLKFLGDQRAAGAITGVTATDMETYRNGEVKSGKAMSTANFGIKVLRAAFGEAKRKGLLLSNPAEAVDLLQEKIPIKKPFTDADVVKLLNAANREWKGMVLLGAHAGLRIGDAASLDWSNIDLKNGVLVFVPRKTSRRNGGKGLRIALHQELLDYLREYGGKDPDGAVFPSLREKITGGYQGLSNEFARVLEKAGLRAIQEDKKPNKATTKGRRTEALSFHSLRHTFITRLADADVQQDVRKEIAGHSSDDIHDRYTHLAITTQQRALARVKTFKLPRPSSP